jgi:hypothetical protein
VTSVAHTSGGSRTVGDILLANASITEEQLADALDRQRATGQPLGQILVESGAITRLDLASALAEQWSDAPAVVRMPANGNFTHMSVPSFPDPIVFDASLAPSAESQAVEELRSYLRAFAHRIDAVELRLGGVAEQHERVAELRHMVTGLVEWASGPELRITELEHRLQQLATSEALEALVSRTHALGEASSSLTDRVEQIVTGVDRAVVALEETVEQLAEAVSTVSAQVEARATVEQLAVVRALVEEIALRPAVDPSLETRVEDLLRGLEQLDARLGETVDVTALDEIRAAVRALAQTPVVEPAEVAALASRLDGLETAMTELLDSVGAAATESDLVTLAGRTAELAARIEEVATAPAFDELRSALDALERRPPGDPELAARVEALAERLEVTASAVALSELRVALEDVAARPVADPSRLDALGERVAELTSRLDGVAVSADGKVDVSVITELRTSLAEVAARPGGDPELAERVEELSTRFDGFVGQLNGFVGQDEVGELRLAVHELVGRPVVDPESIEVLAERVAALMGRLDSVAVSADGKVDATVITELRASLDALADRPTVDPELVRRVEELESRPGVDPALAARVDQLAELLAQASAAPVVGDAEQAAVADLAGRLEELSSRLDVLAVGAQTAVASPASDQAEAPGGEIDKIRVSVESLWMRMTEFQKAVSALLDPRGLPGKIGVLEARLEALEVGGARSAAAAVAAGGEAAGDLREIAKRIEEMEESAASARETMLTRLEKIASSIDWRLQRLESSGTDA